MLNALKFNTLTFAIGNAMLSGNPADFLTSKDDGTFGGIQETAEGILASLYQLALKLGVAVLVIAGIVAAILFGMLKDQQKVKENKAWIIRVLAAAAIIAAILTLVGLFFSVGENVSVSAPTS